MKNDSNSPKSSVFMWHSPGTSPRMHTAIV